MKLCPNDNEYIMSKSYYHVFGSSVREFCFSKNYNVIVYIIIMLCVSSSENVIFCDIRVNNQSISGIYDLTRNNAFCIWACANKRFLNCKTNNFDHFEFSWNFSIDGPCLYELRFWDRFEK